MLSVENNIIDAAERSIHIANGSNTLVDTRGATNTTESNSLCHMNYSFNNDTEYEHMPVTKPFGLAFNQNSYPNPIAETILPKLCPFTTKLPSQTNKIFASVWISPHHILSSSKCGGLSLHDSETGSVNEFTIQYLTTRGCTREDALERPTSTCKSIHDLAFNSTTNQIATAGAKFGRDIAIIKVSPTLDLSHVIEGHLDWVFGVEWINENIIASCSRDCTIRLWYVPTHMPSSIPSCIQTHAAIGMDNSFIRSMVKHPQSDTHIATISKDSSFKIWDVTHSNIQIDYQLNLNNVQQTNIVAANQSNGLFCVGSSQGITLIDPRSHNSTFIDTSQSMTGVRSLSFERDDYHIRCGGNEAKLGVVDMRMAQMMSALSVFERSPEDSNSICTSSLAIFTHSWNPYGNKLYIGGGPIYSNLYGSFSGVVDTTNVGKQISQG